MSAHALWAVLYALNEPRMQVIGAFAPASDSHNLGLTLQLHWLASLLSDEKLAVCPRDKRKLQCDALSRSAHAHRGRRLPVDLEHSATKLNASQSLADLIRDRQRQS